MKNITAIVFSIFLCTQINAQDCIMESGTCPPDILSPYGHPNNLVFYIPENDTRVDIHLKIIRYTNGSGGMSGNEISTSLNVLNSAFSDAKIIFNVLSTQYIDSDEYYTLNNDIERDAIIFAYGETDGINIFFSRGSSKVKCIPTKYVFIDSMMQIDYNYTSLPHEIGHALGLYHTHHEEFGRECSDNGATAGDLLTDTPPDGEGGKASVNSLTCTINNPPGNNDCDEPYNPMINNYMSGYGECRNTFTTQQIGRMHYMLQHHLTDVMFVPVKFSNIVNNSLHTGSSLTVNGTTIVNSGESTTLRFGQNHIAKTNSERLNGNNKHQNWDGINTKFRLSEPFLFNEIYSTEKEAWFTGLSPITINTFVDGFQSTVKFKDPWYVANSTGDQSGEFVEYQTPFTPKGKYDQSASGVFLNMDYGDPNFPYYEIEAPNLLDSRSLYLLGWNKNNVTLETEQNFRTAVRFNFSSASVTVNLKGQLMTNVSTNFTNSGQRKIVRTSDGALHLFYESIGKVWYEQSTNGGASWCQPFSVDDIVGKLSSVCTYGSDIVLAYQKNIDGNAVIQIEKFTPYPGVIQQNSVNNQITTSAAYSSEITPAIISNDNDLLLVSWQENNYVKYQFFWITGSAITLPTQSPSGGTIGTVNTFTPAVAVTPGTGWPKVFHTAFEKRTATSSNIVYRTISVLSSSFKVTISTPTGLSSGSGYTWNYRPSIIAASGDIARVNWIGQRLNPSDPDIQENVSLLKISNGSSFWAYGNTLVTSTQINKSNNGFLLAYSNNGTIYHKNHNNYNSQPNPTISGISGGTVQVAEGLSNNSFYVAALNTTQQPYRFNVGSITLSKEQSHNIAIGRSGVIVQDDAEFYFVLGDISVDGEPVDFVSFHDSLKFPTVSDLNSVLTTQPFPLTNSSQFFYSVQYGTTDSVNAVALFSDAKSASFKVELIDDQTNQVLGSYDQIAFNANNPTQYNNLAYQVNTEGIGNRTVRLRLVASYSGLDPAFGVTNRQATESVMGKRQEKQIKNISFKGSAAITEYALEQNYPNPFNPSTTINYALPKPGFVTLKVYDVLGREVATLVNDHKETGRYSVQFDGSKLSSGTYIYKLTADKFSDVKKLVLIK